MGHFERKLINFADNVFKFLVLSTLLLNSQVSGLTKQLVNVSMPELRPIFVINYDLASVICQTSASSKDLQMLDINILCDGKIDCFDNPAIQDESLTQCSTECTPPCGMNGACLSDGKVSQCYCKSGCHGKSCEFEDKNECTGAPCHWLAQCTNMFGNNYKCSCLNGFTGDGINMCADLDECSMGEHDCPSESQCVNLPGTYMCNCTQGYIPIGAPIKSCQDIDECSNGNFECAPQTYCQNTIGDYKCVATCEDGYELRNGVCADINECESGVCHPRARCTNSVGSYRCECPEGFTGDGITCTPSKSCAYDWRVCDPHAYCVQSLEICMCEGGWSGKDGLHCTDVDECAINRGNCPSGFNCLNVQGGYLCCDVRSTEMECKINSQALCYPDGCGVNAICKNDTCVCRPGFTGNAVEGCLDIDECSQPADSCPMPGSWCVNAYGTYMCCDDEMDNAACHGLVIDLSGGRKDTIPTKKLSSTTRAIPVPPITAQSKITAIPSTSTTATKTIITSTTTSSTLVTSPKDNTLSVTQPISLSRSPSVISSTFQPISSSPQPASSTRDFIDNLIFLTTPTQTVDSSFLSSTISATSEKSTISTTMSTSASEPASTLGPTTSKPSTKKSSSIVTSNLPVTRTDQTRSSQGSTIKLGSTATTKRPGACNSDTDCSRDAYCEKRTGACRCRPGFEQQLQNDKCLDIDECTRDVHQCDSTSTCVNTVGGYFCSCDLGFRLVENLCEDINECLEHDPCDTNADCRNSQGSYECTCKFGFEGNGYLCLPADQRACTSEEHLTNGCTERRVCSHDLFGVSQTVHCDSCKKGYTMNPSGVCVDIDECALNMAVCDRNADCVNTESSYTCRCKEGYTGDGWYCADLDECSTSDQSPCHPLAICANNPGSFSCLCPSGFTGDGVKVCENQDQTVCDQVQQRACGPNAFCIGQDGSALCFSDPGFFWEPILPGGVDINECEEGRDQCDRNRAKCINTEGSYLCECNKGYYGDGYFCQDVDECGISTTICDSNAVCINKPGSYECVCSEGFEGNGTTCHSVCQSDADCTRDAVCDVVTNSCQCQSGFTKDASGSCQDINECEIGTATCDTSSSMCVNTVGHYYCSCALGYRLVNNRCQDINECVEKITSFDVHSVCDNVPGSYNVRCSIGFNGDGYICLEESQRACSLDERLKFGCESHVVCSVDAEDPVKATCDVCKLGYAESGNGGFCVDIDECTLGTHQCDENAKCTNTESSYNCTCQKGYTGDGFYCADIDECTALGDACHSLASCHNKDGDYGCKCPSGYKGDGKTTCESEDRPVCYGPLFKACGDNAECLQTFAGESLCYPNEGHYWDPLAKQAKDIDECAEKRDTCDRKHADCVNTPGGYNCVCQTGYYGDGHTCQDIDECGTNENKCNENANCINIPGAYECSCMRGYKGDGFMCSAYCQSDIDCSRDAYCERRTGACRCRPGFEAHLKDEKCIDIDECLRGTDSCDSSSKCVNTVGSYFCSCAVGYRLLGNTCKDIDECIEHNPCSAFGTCQNTIGSVECKCNARYDGDGYSCLPRTQRSCSRKERTQTGCIDRYVCSVRTSNSSDISCDTCKAGYKKKLGACIDIDECSSPANQCHDNADCVNTESSYTCQCQEGFTGDGWVCNDINECTSLDKSPCHPLADCSNTFGSYKCQCPVGFSGDGITSCVNLSKPEPSCELVDEERCGLNTQCIQQDSKPLCYSRTGYFWSRTLKDSVDIDECVENRDQCDRDNAECINTDGSYECKCFEGYFGDGFVCRDIDECASPYLNGCDENAICVNVPGSYVCACRSGFEGDGFSCLESLVEALVCTESGRDLCAKDNRQCFMSVDGREECGGCLTDYLPSEGLCIPASDSSACRDPKLNNCHPDALCFDLAPGKFLCSCRNGFIGDGRLCDVICPNGGLPNSRSPLCMSNAGNVTCPTDYYCHKAVCCPVFDTNDCRQNTSICHANALCSESGSCECLSGYEGDGIACSPIVESECSKCSANALCLLDSCVCALGYVGDGQICTLDPQDCVSSTDICDNNAICDPVQRRCTCLKGFAGDGLRCNPLPPKTCREDPDICRRNEFCSNVKCVCMDGYVREADDDTCVKITTTSAPTTTTREQATTTEQKTLATQSTTTVKSTTVSTTKRPSTTQTSKSTTTSTFKTTSSITALPQTVTDNFATNINGAVECFPEGIGIAINVLEDFNGKIFVKGQSENPYCSKRFDVNASEGPVYRFKATFERCDIRKLDQGTRAVTIVVQRHPLFIVAGSQAFYLKCTYMEGTKYLKTQYEVSMLTTVKTIRQNGPKPQCRLDMIDAETDLPLTEAVVGKMMRIALSITPDEIYGIQPLNCKAVNMDNGDEHPITTKFGCAYDKELIGDWSKDSVSKWHVDFRTFKWPNSEQIRFQCDCNACDGDCGKLNCTQQLNLVSKRRKRDVSADGGADLAYSSVIRIVDEFGDSAVRRFQDSPMEHSLKNKTSTLTALPTKHNQNSGQFCLSAVLFATVTGITFTVLLSTVILLTYLCCVRCISSGNNDAVNSQQMIGSSSSYVNQGFYRSYRPTNNEFSSKH